uniref:PGG domain-containing protein n=1 Tax=Quercus lobata TaxID=97700 RepID=A0A7N2LP36_QUELO
MIGNQVGDQIKLALVFGGRSIPSKTGTSLTLDSISYNQLTRQALRYAGAPRAPRSTSSKNMPIMMPPLKLHNEDKYKDRVGTLLLVATLVATVTFATAFTVPGGYNGSGGVATFLEKKMFQLFVICNTIAMYSAIAVVVTLIWAQLGDLNLVIAAFKFAVPIFGLALTMVSVAFMIALFYHILILSNLASDFWAVKSFPSDFRAVESFPVENLLPTSLTTLFLDGFQNLRSLDNKGLQHLTSLQQLWIVNCPELKHMPKVGLPVSIYYLRISFSKQCKEKKGKEWRKIAQILQTAQEAQHVAAPSVHFVLTSMSSPTPVFTIKIIKLTRQWSRVTGRESWQLAQDCSVEEAQQDINAAHVESESIENGPGGLFEFIEKRLKEMVIVMQDKGFFLKAWAPTTSRMLLKISYSKMWV